ncbi:MAG: MoxR family ATPase, partial [Actinomycetia bacterium]|nr:MoxR family ATPase [Actinomycetes bacterium]
KVQSALLEAMQENQVTIGDESFPLPQPFLVLATQNPIEQEGTYPLPEAQLDRFLIRTAVGYPGSDHEVELILRRAERGDDRMKLRPVLSAHDLLSLQRRVEDVHISRPVAHYVVDIVEATRRSPRTEAGASPRGSLALLKASRARAAMAGRSHVLPDDVKAIAIPCLAHRLLLQPDQWVRGVRAEQVVSEVLDQVPAPVATEPTDHRRPGAETTTNQRTAPADGRPSPPGRSQRIIGTEARQAKVATRTPIDPATARPVPDPGLPSTGMPGRHR